MITAEHVRQALAFAVRVDDHFTATPWPREVDVALEAGQLPVATIDRTGTRHGDGSYRFLGIAPGAHQLAVTPRDGAFAWTPTTPVTVPLATRTAPVVVELWPGPSAAFAVGTLVIRGRLISSPAGQEVRIEAVGVPPRNRRTRCDDHGEFVFVVAGPTQLTADQRVELAVTVPGRTLTSIQILDGNTNPVIAGTHLTVIPGRETRARFQLI